MIRRSGLEPSVLYSNFLLIKSTFDEITACKLIPHGLANLFTAVRAIEILQLQIESFLSTIAKLFHANVRFKLMDDVFYLGKEGVFIAVKINCELFIDKVKVRALTPESSLTRFSIFSAQ